MFNRIISRCVACGYVENWWHPVTSLEFALICVCLAAVLYMATLYHMAHGNESKAVERGAQIVIDALKRDGWLMDTAEQRPQEAVNIGEEDFTPSYTTSTVPDVIVARNEDMAKQIGDRLMDDLMKGVK